MYLEVHSSSYYAKAYQEAHVSTLLLILQVDVFSFNKGEMTLAGEPAKIVRHSSKLLTIK